MVMDPDTLDAITNIIPDIGVAILFFYIYMKERKINADMIEGLVTAYARSTEAQLKTTHAIDNNTKALEQLVGEVKKIDANTHTLMEIREKINDVWRDSARNTKT